MRVKPSFALLAVTAAFLAFEGRAAAATFTVTATCCTAYTIDAQSNPTLTLTRGSTYTFDVNTPGHPFYIKTAQVTGTTAATLTFAVPASAPATLFYQCSVHSPMTGTINVISAAVPASNGRTLGLLVALLVIGGATAVGLGRRRRPAALG
jgi:hypothetical protein